jgi:hypothetical protein
MKVVYIAHPIAGDIEGNLDKIIGIIREINLTQPDIVPFAHYWVDCHALNDIFPEERQRGIDNDIELFNRKFIDELWLFGNKISKGMKAEIKLCEKLNIPVVCKSEEIFNLYYNENKTNR